MTLSPEKRRALLEAMAEDERLKATQRLRALEELGRMEGRADAGRSAPPEEELPPDPMADLDELEARRVKNRRRRVA